jgi:hypothetical protein
MMQLATIDLVKELGVRKPTWEVHPLKKFFRDRSITYAQVGKVLGVSHQTIFNYLNNKKSHMRSVKEADLQALADRIRQEEKETGMMFNTMVPLHTAIKK